MCELPSLMLMLCLILAIVPAVGLGADKIVTEISPLPFDVLEGAPLQIRINYDVAPELGTVRLHVELKNPANVVLAAQVAEVSGKGSREFVFLAPSRADEAELRFAVWYGEVWTQALVPIIHTEPIAILSQVEAGKVEAMETAAEKWREQMRPQIPSGGAVAVLVDDFPGFDRGTAERLCQALEAHGIKTIPISGEEVCNPAILSGDHFRMLLLPDAQVFPEDGGRTLERFLAQGGDLIALNTPAFTRPVRKIEGKWMGEREYREALAVVRTERVLYDFESGDPQDWTYTSYAASTAEWDFVEGGADGTGRALHCAVPDFRNWNTLVAPEVASPFGPGQSLTCFWAKGGPNTRKLSVEWVEQDGSRWIATVELTEQWRRYVLAPQEFKYWHDNPSEGRGGPDDCFTPERAAKLTLGLSMTHTPMEAGRHEFWVDEIGVAASPLADVKPPEPLELAAVETLHPPYKFYTVRDAARLSVSEAQPFVPPRELSVPAALRSHHPRPQGTGYNKDRKWRWIPLIEARDDKGEVCGYPACLVMHRAGRFANAMIASFALPPEVCAGPKVLDLLVALAERLRDGVFLFEGGSEFYAYFQGDAVKLGARALTLGAGNAAGARAWFVVTGEGGVEFDKTVPLANGAAEVEWSPRRFRYRTYKVSCTLLDTQGGTLDALTHPLVVWEPSAEPRYMEARDGDFYLGGRKWYAHGVNYMPSSGMALNDGELFEYWMDGPAYDPVVVERDLARIEAMGMNMVSIFCYYRSIGSRNLLDCLERCRRHGLLVNLSLRPGTGLDFRWDEMKALIETYRLAENDTVFAYDLAWEPQWGIHERRKPYDEAWERWIVERYGSVEEAEADWGVPAPREDGKITNPLDEQLRTDGPHQAMVSAYCRFCDDLLAKAYGRANRLVKSIDPHHLTSFRMSSAGDPTRGAEWLGYDFRGLARSVDIMEPEGYGRTGEWERVKVGRFTVDYARAMAPRRPVMWAEFGYSTWDRSTMEPNPRAEEWAGGFYRNFYQMVLESEANGSVCWFWPGGFRVGENSDYGVVNPDGTWRPVSQAIQEWSAKITAPREHRPVDEWITFDRDAVRGGGVVGVYEALQERYWKIIEEGKKPGLRTDGYGLDSATAPRRAVGNVAYRPGRNPHKYLNAEIDALEIQDATGCWQHVEDGATVQVVRGKPLRVRATVGNLGDAKWLARPGDGQVGLTCGQGFIPISQDVDFMGTERVEGVFRNAVAELGQVTFEMRALPDVTFGEKVRVKLIPQ